MAQKVLRALSRQLKLLSISELRPLHQRLTFSSTVHLTSVQQLLHNNIHCYYGNRELRYRTYATDSKDPPRPWIEVPFTQLMSLINLNQARLFDIRTVEEVKSTGLIPGATNIPLHEVAEAFQLSEEKFKDKYGVDKPERMDNVIAYCLAGIRSVHAVERLHAAGYPIARHYPGGWQEYEILKNCENTDPFRPHTDIDYKQLMSMIKHQQVQLFDVRTAKEVEATGMMPGATNVPLSDLDDAFRLPPEKFKSQYGVEMPDKHDEDMVVHCLGGIRSLKALAVLYNVGYERTRQYPGGWEEYILMKDR